MGVRPLLESCDHDHKLLHHGICTVDCRISSNATWIVEVPHGESVRERNFPQMFL